MTNLNTSHAAPRLPYGKLAAKSTQALLAFSAAVKESSIGPQLVDLIFLRVSQINGCAYCIDMHWRDLIEEGRDARHLNTLAAWQESPFFSSRERAALAWIDALTRSQHELQDETFAQLHAHFADQEIAEITMAIANMNAWNRIGVGMRMPIAHG
jgi:AhpD family alkylhydroperoxidase